MNKFWLFFTPTVESFIFILLFFNAIMSLYPVKPGREPNLSWAIANIFFMAFEIPALVDSFIKFYSTFKG